MTLFRQSAVLSPDTLRDGSHFMRASGWGEKTHPNLGNPCWDNGENDCSSLVLRRVTVTTRVRAERLAKVAVIVAAKKHVIICDKCFIPFSQCICD